MEQIAYGSEQYLSAPFERPDYFPEDAAAKILPLEKGPVEKILGFLMVMPLAKFPTLFAL